MQVRREWNKVFVMLREKNNESCILYSEKFFFKVKKNKDFLKQKLKKFVASRPALKDMLKEVL